MNAETTITIAQVPKEDYAIIATELARRVIWHVQNTPGVKETFEPEFLEKVRVGILFGVPA